MLLWSTGPPFRPFPAHLFDFFSLFPVFHKRFVLRGLALSLGKSFSPYLPISSPDRSCKLSDPKSPPPFSRPKGKACPQIFNPLNIQSFLLHPPYGDIRFHNRVARFFLDLDEWRFILSSLHLFRGIVSLASPDSYIPLANFTDCLP